MWIILLIVSILAVFAIFTDERRVDYEQTIFAKVFISLAFLIASIVTYYNCRSEEGQLQ